jgi:hypothetical protein
LCPVFSSVEKFDFTNTDFRAFSAGLEDRAADVFAEKRVDREATRPT